jgi:N-acetylgalactosamine-6-sulfatase
LPVVASSRPRRLILVVRLETMNALRKTMLLLPSLWIGFGIIAYAQDQPKPPNVVFMFADDLGYGDLACYGHPYARTPALDQLAKEGTRFTRFYVSGVTCCPSRTGFMTSVHPARFKRYPADYGFGEQASITELLKKRGYATGHFGKWHIGPKKGKAYAIDSFDAGGENRQQDVRGRDAGLYASAIDFIKENATGPFYVNIWGHITHYPVNAPDEAVARFSDLKVNRKDFADAMQHKFDECVDIGASIDKGMSEYMAEVELLDASVQRVLDVLDELGIRDNTIVVFSSDHGPAPVGEDAKAARGFSANMLGYAGGLRGGKFDQYEGGVRSPFIIRWPGRVPAGRVDDTSIISGLDWLPSLCAITGIKDVPANIDGEDVSAAWFGQKRVRKSPLFWRTSSSGAAPSMLEGNWKLHLGKNRRRKMELYDLSADPSESRNVADQHPEVVARLRKKANAWVAELPSEYEKIEKTELKKLKRQGKNKG